MEPTEGNGDKEGFVKVIAMQNDQIRVAHEQMDAAVQSLEGQQSALFGALEAFKASRDTVAGAWSGGAAEAYLGAARECIVSFDLAVGGLKGLGSRIALADAAFRDADEAAAGGLGGR
jgi:WXG100 family type VII secretion target